MTHRLLPLVLLLLAICPVALAEPATSADAPRTATGMTAVPEDTGFCGAAEDQTATCHEWVLTADPSRRFIAYGYEDGIEYGFYERLPDGRYEHRVRIQPVLRDAARPDHLYWAFPWDIRDLALPPDGDGVLATFDHTIVDYGEVYSPAWQQRVPAVLFEGATTQPDATVPALEFESRTLDELRSSAGSEAEIVAGGFLPPAETAFVTAAPSALVRGAVFPPEQVAFSGEDVVHGRFEVIHQGGYDSH